MPHRIHGRICRLLLFSSAKRNHASRSIVRLLCRSELSDEPVELDARASPEEPGRGLFPLGDIERSRVIRIQDVPQFFLPAHGVPEFPDAERRARDYLGHASRHAREHRYAVCCRFYNDAPEWLGPLRRDKHRFTHAEERLRLRIRQNHYIPELLELLQIFIMRVADEQEIFLLHSFSELVKNIRTLVGEAADSGYEFPFPGRLIDSHKIFFYKFRVNDQEFPTVFLLEPSFHISGINRANIRRVENKLRFIGIGIFPRLRDLPC